MKTHDDPEAEGAGLLSSSNCQKSDGHGSLPGHLSARGARLRRAVRHCVQHEPLLLATLLGVAVGVVLGTALSFAHLPSLALEIIGLPGELLMRTLKMLVLPLITASVMAGVCALRQSTADMGKVARYTLLYYFTTTMGAVVLGIIIVNIVRPGRGSPFDQLDPSGAGGSSCHAANQQKVASHAASTGQHSPVEAFLGVIRSAFPDNVFQAAATMNVLGIITVSLLMGAALSSMGPEAAPMVTLINIFNEAIAKIVNWVIWTSPVGIASLITTSICRACNLAATLEALGLFILAVLMGLLLWGFIILPLIYYATTRRDPRLVYRGFSQAMVTAFGTDSSNATLPITMRSAVQMGCDPRVVQFFLPLGTTVNMNGTALYEAVTVIFIAQAHGVVLGAAGTVIVALTATLAAVGAAGIPSAGLVTMLMVLQAVDLEQYASDIAIILAVDWFLDRCRTVVNVLGDSFGTVIIDHHARKWVMRGSGDPTRGHQDDCAGDRDGGCSAVGSGCVEMAAQPPPLPLLAPDPLAPPSASPFPTAVLQAATWKQLGEGGVMPSSQDQSCHSHVHRNHHDSDHKHHNQHNRHSYIGGLFHPQQRSDPEGVRQGLLLSAGSCALNDESSGRESADGDEGAASNAASTGRGAGPLHAGAAEDDASGLGMAPTDVSSTELLAGGFGPSSRSASGSGTGSGPAPGSGSMGHIKGSELHHRHPYVLSQGQGQETGRLQETATGVGAGAGIGTRAGQGREVGDMVT